MGLFTYTIAGAGFIAIGIWESILASMNQNPNSRISSNTNPQNPNSNPKIRSLPTSSTTFAAVFVFSLLFIIHSISSIFNAVGSHDRVGSALQLQIIAIASLFLLYSVLGLVSNSSGGLFPSSLVDLIGLFAFGEEFLLFYLQRKDKTGIENRYFDLMLVPIMICLVSFVLELKNGSGSSSNVRLVRGIGLILHGTWFVQMGISFFSDLIVNGCSLHEKSKGNYTIKCKGHMEQHRGGGIATLQFNCHLALLVAYRGGGIATLQFNCHLALLVALAVGFCSIMGVGNRDNEEFTQYKPLGAEMQHMENHGQFTLDSDEDDIRDEENASKRKEDVVAVGVNGHVYHK